MPSQALTAMSSRLRDLDQLMAAHTAVAGPKRGRKYEVEALNRAAILLLCSHFEGYLEDLMAEALAGINGALNSSSLTYGFHNPWPDRIDGLFAFLGMQGPTKSISWQKAGNKAVRDNLAELVRRETSLPTGPLT